MGLLGGRQGSIALALALVVLAPRAAEACGGCFGTPAAPTEVTGHRMAFSISETQTVLWDQFEYQGNPEDFSWVLPVRPGAYVELAQGAWLTALDTFTTTYVNAPVLSCARSNSSEGGCACGAASSSDSAASRGEAPGGGVVFGGDVTVVRRERVGPYDTVVLRSEEPDALRNWLTDHGYAVPEEIEPVIDAYVEEGNDFLALRLAPEVGVAQMEPVRVITPGGDYLLPLRMVAAGVSAYVDIKLFIIAEARYTMPDMAEVIVPERELAFDFALQSSNYLELRNDTLQQNSGKSAIVPFARQRPFDSTNFNPQFGGPVQYVVQSPTTTSVSASATTLAQLYFAQAAVDDGIEPTCRGTIAELGSNGLVAGACPVGQTCETPAPTTIPSQAFVCSGHDDLAVALSGMRPASVWLTRLEMNLPLRALDADCVVEPAFDDEPVDPFLQARKAVNPPCTPPLFTSAVGGLLAALISIGSLVARRRARRTTAARSAERKRGARSTIVIAAVLASLFPRAAEACGGCFGLPASPTQVTAHRMAFSISETQTVLWDQFEYQGSPEDFSWVLPVRPGAYVELADGAWLSSLDAFTSTTVLAPRLSCASSSPSGGGGCGCGAGDYESAGLKGQSDSNGVNSGDGVTVVRRERVGPYDTVVLRSDEPDALRDWLGDNGYAVPEEIEPVIDAYVEEGNDFLALRLAPDVGVAQMEPVRVITPGGDYLLPLRMVAAGVGADVEITLFVIAEGRYTMPDMAEVQIDDRSLSYDFFTRESNFLELRNDALQQNSGKSAIVPFARNRPFDTANVDPTFQQPLRYSVQGSSFVASPPPTTLADLYFVQASADQAIQPSCRSGSLPLSSSALVVPACAGTEPCPQPSSGQLSSAAFSCGGFDDLAVALSGLRPDRVWLTRFEMKLPVSALDADCIVEPGYDDSTVQPFVQARKAINPPCSPPLFTSAAGSLFGALVAIGSLVARRRTRGAGAR
jgi:hypothetical protein